MIQVNFEQVVNAHIPNIKIEEVGYIGRRVYVMLRMPDDVMHFYTCFEQKGAHGDVEQENIDEDWIKRMWERSGLDTRLEDLERLDNGRISIANVARRIKRGVGKTHYMTRYSVKHREEYTTVTIESKD
ncbi:MAG: hypothetical protein AABX19_01970 [Nanoarchaeota archaeon]|mgnify:CR=1 FL=1